MPLGWHYRTIPNAYALNQYLASRGFVLSVNYRRGIGYGYDFHLPPTRVPRGAADIETSRPRLPTSIVAQVDAGRIGIYGGSYGH
jgi:hypothetical protein